MGVRHSPADPDRKKMLDEIEAVIRKYAASAPGGYIQRMKQVETFAIDRAGGDMMKKAVLKKALMAETGGRCMGPCGKNFSAAALQLHRVDAAHRFDEARNCGYFRENVQLLCADCHRLAEEQKQR